MNTRTPLRSAALLAMAASASAQAPERSSLEDPDLVIAAVHVVDVEAGRTLAGRDVVIDEGRVVAVLASDSARWPLAPRVLDGAGLLVARQRGAVMAPLASGVLMVGFVAGEAFLLNQDPPVPTPTEGVYLASGALTAGLALGLHRVERRAGR